MKDFPSVFQRKNIVCILMREFVSHGRTTSLWVIGFHSCPRLCDVTTQIPERQLLETNRLIFISSQIEGREKE